MNELPLKENLGRRTLLAETPMGGERVGTTMHFCSWGMAWDYNSNGHKVQPARPVIRGGQRNVTCAHGFTARHPGDREARA
jgi:hypothetical protein